MSERSQDRPAIITTPDRAAHFERSAFRVEARDRYEVDDERERARRVPRGQDAKSPNRSKRSLAGTRNRPESSRTPDPVNPDRE
ncbi:MAG: DUF6879 family protein [Solirubrobacteraceae bacterium]